MYEVDWTQRWVGVAAAVVRPRTTAEVASVVRVCIDDGLRVVPQGGNTGLVGGSVPRSGEIVLSLKHLDWVRPVDALASTVTAGAGVTLGSLQEHVRASGHELGVDFAARDSATIGGVAATNAGGSRVLGFGMTRDQIRGVEAVLPDGGVARRLGGLVKDNCGYDLPGLFVGSEGTLGIITAVCMRVFPRTTHRTAALVGLDRTEDALEVLARLRRRVAGLQAADIFFADGLQLVSDHLSLRPPFPIGYDTYLLVEAAAPTDVEDVMLESLAETPAIRDATVASDSRSRAALWRYREGHSEAISARGVPVKLDVAVPLRTVPGFVRAVRRLIRHADGDASVVLFGHLAEGNLHVNILGLPDDAVSRASDAVLHAVGDLGGTIAAEHGVGVAKVASVGLSRTVDDVDAMGAIKRALDPRGLFNPGVLFPPGRVRGAGSPS